MIMWDPAVYPDVKTIADLGKSDMLSPLLQRRGVHGLLHHAGHLSKDQVDGSYDGDPGTVHRRRGQGRPAGLRLRRAVHLRERSPGLGQAGEVPATSTTPAGTTTPSRSPTKPENITKYADCFKELVPIIQHSSVDYLNDPAAANAIILDAVATVRQRLGLQPGRGRLRREDDQGRRPRRQRS